MRKLNAISASASGFLVCGLMLLLVVEIIGRKLNHPIPGATEIAGMALVAVVFLGLAHCEELRGHIRVEFLISRFSPRSRRVVELFGYFIGFVVYTLLTWQTGVEAAISWDIHETIPTLLQLPVYPAKTIVPIGCALIDIQIIINAFKWIRIRS